MTLGDSRSNWPPPHGLLKGAISMRQLLSHHLYPHLYQQPPANISGILEDWRVYLLRKDKNNTEKSYSSFPHGLGTQCMFKVPILKAKGKRCQEYHS